MNWNKLLRTAFVAVLLLMLWNGCWNEEVTAKQKELADELIRFHVRANSDSVEDQELKLKVRDAVVEYMGELLRDSDSVAKSQEILELHMEDVLHIAMQVIHEQGYSYDLAGYLVDEYFPLRTYGDIALPPGRYKAFRIDIGDAAGKNWWCVLYPPLCFVDLTHSEMSEATKETVKMFVDECQCSENEQKMAGQYEIDFKYLKFLNKWIK